MPLSPYILYGVLAFFMLLIGSALFKPLRFAIRTAFRVAFAFCMLVICSISSSFFGVAVGINAINTAVVTLLGPAGAILLALLGWSFT